MVSAAPHTPISFIDGRGGPTAVAGATGFNVGAVNLWRHRNKIPRSAWPEVLAAYSDVTIADLLEIEQLSGRERITA